MVIDKVTLEKWRAEFCIHAKSEGYNITDCITNFGVGFVQNETQALWEMYRLGRRHQSASVSLVTVPVVTDTNWHDVNTVARGGG